MYTHEYDVYETLGKLDALLETGQHKDPTPMDKTEYKLLTNRLVQGTVELLRHLALHDVLVFETADDIEPVSDRHISAIATDVDGGYSDELVALELPTHLVPYGAIIEAMREWNVGTVETVADLAVLAGLWNRYLMAEADTETETTTFHEWARQAERVGPAILRAIQLADAAGMLHVNDARTGTVYGPAAARIPDDGVSIELVFESEPDSPPARTRTAAIRKTTSRKKARRK
jgi:hypothetical protein